ncbi:hypothetical protein Tco_0624629 [Tanacetum coccineum]|uniref:Uncharacterized protein n=1 Tax=Tanacetum coccineum TaxID=301880 RepID=A0ABQ4WEK6_9ASTR
MNQNNEDRQLSVFEIDANDDETDVVFLEQAYAYHQQLEQAVGWWCGGGDEVGGGGGGFSGSAGGWEWGVGVGRWGAGVRMGGVLGGVVWSGGCVLLDEEVKFSACAVYTLLDGSG